MYKKYVAVERLNTGAKWYYRRGDGDPSLFDNGQVGFKILCESDDPKECQAAVAAAFKEEGRTFIQEYLNKALDFLKGL